MAEASKANVRRVGQIIRLKRAVLEEYKEYHRNVWPGVAAQIKDSGISDYSIFLDERTMTLFSSFKWTGTDWDADMTRMKNNSEVQKWWKIMDSYQESFHENATGSTGDVPWWFELQEVFRLE